MTSEQTSIFKLIKPYTHKITADKFVFITTEKKLSFPLSPPIPVQAKTH